MDYNWCHGPKCHTNKTQDRIRGVKGSKVLRTKKVTNNKYKSMFGNGGASIWDYFCNHRCLMDFVSKHTQAMLNIEPRTEAHCTGSAHRHPRFGRAPRPRLDPGCGQAKAFLQERHQEHRT